jgi:uncharacterized membrane protein YcfT
MGSSLQNGTPRIDWVDCAKGLCIIMVVMMHSTLGVEDVVGREGFMHGLVAFAKPFRMPDFFLISGLFLSRVIDRDWRTYLDRKVVHFAYFYVLWVTIQFVVKAPNLIGQFGLAGTAFAYLEAFVEPFGTLWFIYLLPIFFVVTKLARGVHPALVFAAAALLEIAPIETGWTVIDEFASRFVYFYVGYLLATHIFVLATWVQEKPRLALVALASWAVVNGALVADGYAGLPVVSLALGFAGAMAIVAVAALTAKLTMFAPVRYAGENSIVIYLAFFLPMLTTRLVLLKTGLVPDVGAMALIVTIAGIVGPLVIWWLVRNTRLNFLFVRPERFTLKRRPTMAMQPAE